MAEESKAVQEETNDEFEILYKNKKYIEYLIKMDTSKPKNYEYFINIIEIFITKHKINIRPLYDYYKDKETEFGYVIKGILYCNMYFRSNIIKIDEAKALINLEKADKIYNNPIAIYTLGKNYFSHKNYEKAFIYYLRACDLNYAPAYDRLARMYFGTYLLKRDLSKIKELMLKAYQLNYSLSVIYIAKQYAHYHDNNCKFELDNEKAKNLMEKLYLNNLFY